MSKETQAARALLAYFNRPLITRLVKLVLNESSPEVRKKVANEIINELVPKATNEAYNAVLEKVNEFSARYLAGETFRKKMEEFVAHNLIRWMESVLEAKIVERARAEVERYTKTLDGSSFLKTLPGRFQAAAEAEIQRRAKEAAERGAA